MAKLEVITTKQEYVPNKEDTPSSKIKNEKTLRNLLRLHSKKVFQEFEDVAKSECNIASPTRSGDKREELISKLIERLSYRQKEIKNKYRMYK